MSDRHRRRLRGTTLVAAPFALVGLIGASATLSLALWGVWHRDELGGLFVTSVLAGAAVSIAGLVAARGCFVEVTDGELRDVVAWRTRRSFARRRVVEARVLAGAWRWFEIELDDADLVTLLGASPVQFPARMLPGAQEQDLADLATLAGRTHPDPPAPAPDTRSP